jgi:hypothetical protein
METAVERSAAKEMDTKRLLDAVFELHKEARHAALYTRKGHDYALQFRGFQTPSAC